MPAYQPPPIVNVNGYNPGYGAYPTSPYGSYLSGKADLVNASGQYGIQVQQANLLQEDVHKSMLQSRRDVLNEARYERETTMNSEQVRQQGIIDALHRARNEPPLNEIWSGLSLNALFSDIKKANTYGVRGPTVPLDQDMLKHINLTTGVTSAGAGVLKDGPKLQWPSALQDPAFKDNRSQLETMTTQALQQAMKGMVAPKLVGDMTAIVETMQVQLKQQVATLPPGPYMEAKKYLRELNTSYSALNSPNATNYFNGKYSAQGATVYDLATYMTNNGLQFARRCPAISRTTRRCIRRCCRMTCAWRRRCRARNWWTNLVSSLMGPIGRMSPIGPISEETRLVAPVPSRQRRPFTERSRCTTAIPTPTRRLPPRRGCSSSAIPSPVSGSVHVPLYSRLPGLNVSTTSLSLSTSTRANGLAPTTLISSFGAAFVLNSSPMRCSPLGHRGRCRRSRRSNAASSGVQDHALAAVLLGQHHAVGDVRRDVVAGRLEAETIALLQAPG